MPEFLLFFFLPRLYFFLCVQVHSFWPYGYNEKMNKSSSNQIFSHTAIKTHKQHKVERVTPHLPASLETEWAALEKTKEKIPASALTQNE